MRLDGTLLQASRIWWFRYGGCCGFIFGDEMRADKKTQARQRLKQKPGTVSDSRSVRLSDLIGPVA